MYKYVLRLTDALIKQAAPKDKLFRLAIGAFVRAETLPVNASSTSPVRAGRNSAYYQKRT
ncbi:hypothetical protein [Janthinobacterium sp. MDB2-8]|uniref:hypothetical protein n=1 Tax=Janthinobacterium sp. MDB2-8 TaxID=1259338 RepID=UPI003F243A07